MYNNKLSIPNLMNIKEKDSDRNRLILKGGRIVDPGNQRDTIGDLVVCDGLIVDTVNEVKPEKGDTVIDCEGLIIFPGLLDMHLHLGDLFEVSTQPIQCAVEDGVTIGLSPGAGNTFMAPALLGAEIDRGLPINIGVYLGAANVLGTCLSVDELVHMFNRTCEPEILFEKMSRNGITNASAAYVMGIKDHMGHFIMSDENIDKIYNITSQAHLIYMSHTQDPQHAERVVSLSKGRPLHLGHVTAAGCGTHIEAEKGIRTVLELIDGEVVTGEFVTTMLRRTGGSREGLKMPKVSQQLVYDALNTEKVNICVSDGQNQSTMKGFGDTRDNIPAIFELVEMGVLSLSQAIATMTINPAKLIAKRTNNTWWSEKIGNLGIGACANITIVNQQNYLPVYTIVNGKIVAFENRLVREGYGAGGWMSQFGMNSRTGIGDLVMFNRY